MISRRELLTGSAATSVIGIGLLSRPVVAVGAARSVADLERSHGGRLGVAVLDTAGNRLIEHRGDERFPLCSTHKALAAGFVLARVDRGAESLTRRITYERKELVAYSPVTERYAGGAGMTVGELCEAAVTLSDNTAANLLLDSIGGPAALTTYLRSLGDPVTRLDRRETALNEAAPGDPRDTTTPLAMAETMRRLVLGDALSPASREQLAAWLVACKTGDKRLRAGFPAGWRVGDKTGSGGHNATNDVVVAWPRDGAPPITIAAYYIDGPGTEDERSAVLGDIARLATGVAPLRSQ